MCNDRKPLPLINPPARKQRRLGRVIDLCHDFRATPLFRALVRLSCALVKCPHDSAAIIDNSPASAIDAQTSASACALPSPTKPIISRQAFCVGSAVPPPTVPTIKFGNVTAVYKPPSEVT